MILLFSMIFSILNLSNVDLMLVLTFMIILKSCMFNDDEYYSLFFYMDSMSLNMIIMTCWIMLIIMLISHYSKEKIKIIGVTTLIMLMFFCVNNLIFFFLLFELSLIPIFVLVVGYGQQPERLKAGRSILMYMVLTSLPLLFFLLLIYFKDGSLLMSMFLFNSELCYFTYMNFFVLLGMILVMLVKIPMFFMHSWLPKAHVEAPLQGSMILAGVMLKMGLYGMLRLVFVIPSITWSLALVIMSLSMLGSVFSCWMALNSDDVKVTVAYSSISHMNFLIMSVMSMKLLSLNSSFIIMFSHGLCSSALFFLVTEMYKVTHSRSIIIMKGFSSKFPVLVLFSFINWAANLAAPPSMSFIGEILGISCIMSISVFGSVMACAYMMFNSFYSMFNFSIQSHSFSKVNYKFGNVSILFMISFFWMMIPLLLLFFFFDFSLI